MESNNSLLLKAESVMVEAILNDQLLVISCDPNIQIKEFGEIVLSEYCKIYPRAAPTQIKFIKDEKVIL